MKKMNLLFAMALLSAVSLPVCAQVSNDNEDGVYKVDQRMMQDYVPGQVLVKMKDGSPANVRRVKGKFQSAGLSQLDAVLSEFGVEDIEQLLPQAKVTGTPRRAKAFNGTTIVERDLTQLYKVTLPEEKAHETMQLVERLKALDEVEYAEPNYKMYITDAEIAGSFLGNPYVTQQWYLDSYGVKQLWNKPVVNPTRPVIAIIDTGVDLTHPDLAPNLWTNTAEAEGEVNYDNDGNGFKGDVHGWDFINNTGNVKDFNMHGTHVAGIAAAANNGIGIVGANPRALIMPVSVMQSDGTGDVATIVKGIDYAVANGATVLNLSLGTYANSRALRQSLERAYQTAVIVAAAGNDGLQILPVCNPMLPYGPMFPAAYSFVLGVQATTNTGALAAFSNYDCDGPNYSSTSTLQDPDGFNYELKAPGTNMLSTIPGGKYKVLQGTSMAAPLVAGAISALKMVKQYDTQEILWGDLLHTDNIVQAYAVTNRPAELDLMKIMYRERKELADETEADYSGDGEIDAGETVSLYPVIRTTFGGASNIKMHLEMGDEFEDPNTVEILTGADNKVNFGLHLDAYGKGVSLNPLRLKVADNIANNRHIKMKIVATCDESNVIYEGLFTLIINNIVKIGGIISEDMTLNANKNWLVQSNLAIPEGITLTIEPGTIIMVNPNVGIASEGKIKAIGEPGKMIHITQTTNGSWKGIITKNLLYWNNKIPNDTLEYCIIDGFVPSSPNSTTSWPFYKNCIITCSQPTGAGSGMDWYCYLTNMTNCSKLYGYGFIGKNRCCNIINNELIKDEFYWSNLKEMNFFNNKSYKSFGSSELTNFSMCSKEPSVIGVERNEYPSYLGTSRMDLANSYAYDVDYNNGYCQIDLSNMLTTPITEAHGIVWKVCVNGKDAQDEYEDLAPLGVGKHKFEVYFNRPMNKAVAPQIAFGVRDPYTQNAVSEDGSWNEEGTIYTAYKTITGKTKSDGVNRIYVWGAEDNEYFEIPYEKTRFNVMINAAGSMATGFAGEAKMGRVELTWNNENNDFDDAMGFNIYRYQLDNDNNEVNNTRINQEIVDIETTEYTDYDVTPGETYYYTYKVLSTDLKEYDVSNVVAVTPLTATLGDANGSGDVDVADVITTVNYAAGMEPKPFIFEAADMNTDQSIDILDVIGIIQKILNPSAAREMSIESTATYTIENGTLYVESPVALAGVQVQLNLDAQKDIKVAEDLNGFEHTSAWLTDNDYLFLAYNMNGKTLTAGKHALLEIGDANITTLRLSDAQGHNVLAIADETTSITTLGSKVKQQGGIFNLKGQKVSGKTLDLKKLPKGVYIINGEKVVK